MLTSQSGITSTLDTVANNRETANILLHLKNTLKNNAAIKCYIPLGILHYLHKKAFFLNKSMG